MRRLSFICVPLIVLSATTQALASENSRDSLDTYFGVSGAFLNIAGSGRYYEPSYGSFSFNEDIDGGTSLGILVGTKFNQWVSAEVRGYLGVADADFYGEDLEISKYFAFYAKPTLPLHQYFSIYGLIGYDALTAESYGDSETESDFSYGAGIEIGKGTNVKLQIEWVVLHDKNYNFDFGDGTVNSNLEISSINANIAWYF